MKTTYEIDGKSWIKISDAARLLKTNAIGVRKLMGKDVLEWHQSRANSPTMPPMKPMKRRSNHDVG